MTTFTLDTDNNITAHAASPPRRTTWSRSRPRRN